MNRLLKTSAQMGKSFKRLLSSVYSRGYPLKMVTDVLPSANEEFSNSSEQ